MKTYQYSIYEKKNHIAYVTFNRPEVMNALHAEAHAELGEIFEDFATDDTVQLAIVTGSGRQAFCAGNDLKATAQANTQGVSSGLEGPWPFGGITSRFSCSKPLIAAVNGIAVGGGFEIALACDLIIATEHARFALPEPRVGLFAASGGVHRLSRHLPLKQAMGLLLTGRHFTAQQAHDWGLVNEVVPMEECLPTAELWADEILQCSSLSIQATKKAVMSGLHLPVEQAMQQDRPLLAQMLASQDFVEGAKAFVAKRQPQWKGR